MIFKKIMLCACTLFLLFVVLSCNNDLLSTEKENTKNSSQAPGVQTPGNHLTRSNRPCETSCGMQNEACHSNCGANGSCHEQCDAAYRGCIGYWTTIKVGTSICSIDKKINYLALGTRVTIYLKARNTLGFFGCDGTIWPDYGNQYNSSTLHQRAFWSWQGGDIENWINSEIAEHGYGC